MRTVLVVVDCAGTSPVVERRRGLPSLGRIVTAPVRWPITPHERKSLHKRARGVRAVPSGTLERGKGTRALVLLAPQHELAQVY